MDQTTSNQDIELNSAPVSLEIQHLKLQGSIDWNIHDFLEWTLFSSPSNRLKKAVKLSSVFDLDFPGCDFKHFHNYLKLETFVLNFIYKVYQGFSLDLVKNSKMIIFASLLTTFNVRNNFWGCSVIICN